jgi:hypothetical protein
VQSYDTHGLRIREYGYSTKERKDAAAHRALTAYLMAEMVRDGLAPGGNGTDA